jgi:flagellar protein FlaI
MTDETKQISKSSDWNLSNDGDVWFVINENEGNREFLTYSEETVKSMSNGKIPEDARFSSESSAKNALKNYRDNDKNRTGGSDDTDIFQDILLLFGFSIDDEVPNEEKENRDTKGDREPGDESFIDKILYLLGFNVEKESEGYENEELSILDNILIILGFNVDTELDSLSRPDARNVSMNFFDGPVYQNIPFIHSVSYSEEVKSVSQKYSSDKDVRNRDLVDLPKRLGLLFNPLKGNSYATLDFLDTTVNLFITIIGSLLFLVGSAALLTGTETVLTSPSGYGAMYMIVSVLLASASFIYWVSRRTGDVIGGLISWIGRIPVYISAIAQLLVGVFLIVGLSISGSAFSILFQIRTNYINTFTTEIIPQTLPASVVTVIEQLNAVAYEPMTGLVSVYIASMFAIVIGTASTVPVVKRSMARIILTATYGPREFRRETGLMELDSDDEAGIDLNLMDGEEAAESVHEEFNVNFDDNNMNKQEISDDEQEPELSDETDMVKLSNDVLSSPYRGYVEKERYWVQAPYAYISILYNEKSNDHRYYVVEPQLDDSEQIAYDELKKRLDERLLFEDIEEHEDTEVENRKKRHRLEELLIELSNQYDIDVGDRTFHRLTYYVTRDYINYNKINPLMNDPNVEDISCDGEGENIFVYHGDYNDTKTNVKFDKHELRSFIQELAQRSGQHVSSADPMVDASLPDGSRAQMTLGTEVTGKGSTFTIRLFEDTPFTPVDLLNFNTFSVGQMAYLWSAIKHNKSLIFAGGTASGKTTSMNAVSMFIPPKAKVITIEDTREISLPQDNWIPAYTRDSLGEDGEDINMYNLLEAALRQRPEYLVVGEIRGDEAQTLFQAMSTGHTTYSTMHAETVKNAIGRLTNEPINVPRQMITSLDIICIQNQIRMQTEDGDVNNVRRNEETREIVQLRDDGQFENRRPFKWDPETDTFIESLDNSNVLERIQKEEGWSRDELNEDIRQRKEVLEYMTDNDITAFGDVWKVVQGYMIDSDNVISQIRNDELDPDELDDISEIETVDTEPDTTLSDETDTTDTAQPALQGD